MHEDLSLGPPCCLVDGVAVKVSVMGRDEAVKTTFLRQLVGKPLRSSYKPTSSVRLERVLVKSSDSMTFMVDLYQVPSEAENRIKPNGIIRIPENRPDMNICEYTLKWASRNRGMITETGHCEALEQKGAALGLLEMMLRKMFDKDRNWKVKEVTRMKAKMIMPGVALSVVDSGGRFVTCTQADLALRPEIDLQPLSKRGVSVATPLQACIQELVRMGRRSSDVFLMAHGVQDELLTVLPLIDPIDFTVTVPQSVFVLETNKRVLEIQEMVQAITRGLQIGQCVASNKDDDFSKCQLILGTSKAIAQAILSGGLNVGSLCVCVFDSPGNKCSDEFQELIMSKLPESTQVIYNDKTGTLRTARGVLESHWCGKFRPNMLVVQYFQDDDAKT